MGSESEEITIEMMRESFYSAVVSDALDGKGYRNQCIGVPLPPYTGVNKLVGRCKTTLWEEIDFEDPEPYALELKAVDACRPDEVLVAAAGGSMRSGIWGELLTTASRNTGCVGAIIDGAVRDITPIKAMDFPVFARGVSPYDSLPKGEVCGRTRGDWLCDDRFGGSRSGRRRRDRNRSAEGGGGGRSGGVEQSAR